MNLFRTGLLTCALGAGFLAFGADYTYTVGAEGQTMAVGDIPADATTVTKAGPGVLTFTGDKGAFAGKFVVETGTVKARANAFAAGSSVEVKPGATWDMAGGGSTWSAPSPAAFTIAGAGDSANGYDAAFVRSSGTVIRSGGSKLVLTADATAKYAIQHNPGSIDLKGFRLTKKGNGMFDTYSSVVITPGEKGGIDFIEGSQLLTQDGNPYSSATTNNTLRFESAHTFEIYTSATIPWAIEAAANISLCAHVNSKPSWSGPVSLTGGGLILANNGANSRMTVKGDVTSSGAYGIDSTVATEAQVDGNVKVGGNVTASGSGTTVFNGAVEAAGVASSGVGTLIFTNDVALSGNVKASGSGTTVFNGAVSLTNGTSVSRNDKGLLRFEGCPKVEVAGPFGASNDKFDMGITGRTEVVNVKYFKHGGATFLNGSMQMPQTLVVSNSTWNGVNTDMTIGNNFSKGRVFLYDSVFTNNVRLGNSQWEQWGDGMGAVYQHRGETYVGNFAYHAFSLGRAQVKSSSYGYYLNDDGKFTDASSGANIGPQGLGIFEMTGGMASGSGNWEIAAGPGAGIYLQTGGTNEVYGMKLGKADGAGHGLVAIEGEGACLQMRAGGSALLMVANNTTGSPFNLVVNDGATLALNAAGMKRSAAVAEGATTRWYCSFDGGVLRPGWFGDFAGSGATAPDRTIVGAGGFAIDTSKDGGDETWAKSARYGQVLECPTGKVVTAISLPTDERFLGADGALYLGPTDVTISGKGVGAAAVAVFDEKTRRITGIRVVAGGTGYDENTTATLTSADMSVQYVCAVTVTDAPTTGAGFVKRGIHALRLDNANTYKGPTTVEGGTLYLNSVESLPAGSALVVDNAATLALQKNSFTTPSLTGGGTVKNGTLVTSALNLTTDSRMTLDGAELHLADGAVVTLTGDLSALDKTQKYALVSGTVLCDGSVTLPTLPDRWKLSVRGSGITLKQERGLALVIR